MISPRKRVSVVAAGVFGVAMVASYGRCVLRSAPVSVSTPSVTTDAQAQAGDARERILSAAYELFSRHGIRAVGIDAVITRSGVARMTLYRHFASKDDLVLAFLERREQLWTKDWLEAEVERRASEPVERLLAIFDVFDEWFRREDFEGCSFINVLLETAGARNDLHWASAGYLERIRAFLRRLATDAGVADPEAFAREWHILMKGSIVAAHEGDVDAATRARDLGSLLIARDVPA
jgi:AcrR family transcriptional regulator